MNSSEEFQNPIYLIYKEPGIHFDLFFPALIYAFLAFVGIPLNLSVCYLTAKYRRHYFTLGSNTGILLAFNSFFEILHQSAHFVFFAITVSGINFIPIRTAIWLEGHTVVGFISALFMVSLSLDRLFAVAAPLAYRRLNQRIYICVHLTILLGNGFYSLNSTRIAASEYPDWPVTGFIGDLFSLPGLDSYSFFISFGGLILTVLFYFIIAIIVKCKTEASNERMDRLYRSLFIIVFVNVGGYLIAGVAITLFMLDLLCGITEVQFYFINFGTGIFLNIASISNAPILYINSQEYRKVYIKEIKRIQNGLFRVFGPKRIQQSVNLNGKNNILVVPASIGPIRTTFSIS